jgi:hypothetical protein
LFGQFRLRPELAVEQHPVSDWRGLQFGELLHGAASLVLRSPREVTEGEPVTVTATGSNFNPKHTVGYAWTTNGGKLDSSDKQSARIDTTGVAAGSYSANATISDAKMKKGGSATCAASFTVKAKPMNPPQVSCSANPSTVQSGSPST